jgi:hypothetical protein
MDRSAGAPLWPSVETEDDVAGSLRELAARYVAELGPHARIEHVFGRGEGVRFQPLRPGAAPVGWVDCGDELLVFAGEYGRLRFPRRPGDVELVQLICDAIITGHAREERGPARTHLTIESADGRVHRLAAGKGSLKSALHSRRVRAVAYQPYF